LGRSDHLSSGGAQKKNPKAMEGSESGFGSRLMESGEEGLEGGEGRFKAVYVT
jgi:hypothetical protein